MNTLLFLIIVSLIILTVVTVGAFFTWLSNKPAGPTRRERDLERTQDEIRELAYQYRDVDQGLAEAVIAKIAEFNRKELS